MATSLAITRAVVVRWFAVLLVIWGFVSLMRFSEHTSAPIIFPSVPGGNDETGSVPESLVASPATVTKHTDRAAVIIEDRPLGNLVPVLLHFHSVLGPEWPIILYTSLSTAGELMRSAPFSRAVAASEIEIRYLPVNTTFHSRASVSAFLTSPYLWTDLAPYAKILLFQTDSMLCSSSPDHIDRFLDYDFVGAPIDARVGRGFNGGLSLRNRELVLRVLERWDFAVDSAADDGPDEWKFEDQWLFSRMRELGGDAELAGEMGIQVNLPDWETSSRFAAETVWTQEQRPLGFHQPHRWLGDYLVDIVRYCPEVGMISGADFFE